MDTESKLQIPTEWLEHGPVVKADGSVGIGIVHVRRDASNPQEEIREPASQELLSSGRVQFWPPHLRHLRYYRKSPRDEENSVPSANAGIRARVLRRLAQAAFGLGQIFYRLGQRCRAWSVPAQSTLSSELPGQDSPGYTLEEILELLGYEDGHIAPEEPSLPVAKSFTNDFCPS